MEAMTAEQAASEKHYLMKPPLAPVFYAAEEGGMTVYIACRYENQKGEAGQWGPLASAIIP